MGDGLIARSWAWCSESHVAARGAPTAAERGVALRGVCSPSHRGNDTTHRSGSRPSSSSANGVNMQAEGSRTPPPSQNRKRQFGLIRAHGRMKATSCQQTHLPLAELLTDALAHWHASTYTSRSRTRQPRRPSCLDYCHSGGGGSMDWCAMIAASNGSVTSLAGLPSVTKNGRDVL